MVLAAVVILSTNPEASDGSREEADDFVFGEMGVYSSVEDALRAAVINYNQTYAVPADFHCASVYVDVAMTSFVQSANSVNMPGTYYVYSLYKDMDLSEDGITELVTISSPMIIALVPAADGGYHIIEDGVTSVNEFPELYVVEGSQALSDLYEKVLCMDCHAQAVEYGQLNTDAIIGGLVDHIAGEPLASSATQEYISHSPVEYRELIYYGKYTIAYAEAYRQTGATDLKMAILDCAEAEIRSYIERPDEAQQEQSGNYDAIAGQKRNEFIAITEQELNELIAQQEQLNQFIDKMVWPTTGSTISQVYGNWQGYDGETYFSDHICIAGEEGDPVYAAMDGVVEETGYTADYGNYIVILGGDEIRTRYGHLKSVEITEETQVAAGEEIGTVGKTGRATGNCLHFAITDHGVPIDPLLQSD